jgi:hypothetical protein
MSAEGSARLVLVALTAGALLGCAVAGEVQGRLPDGASRDGAPAPGPDAPAPGSPDARTDSPLADSVVTPDATPGPIDAATVACTVNGVVGECIDVALCDDGRVATPGHCTGDANIQCCTVAVGAPDAGTSPGLVCSVDSNAQPGVTAGAGWCPHDPSAQPNADLVEEPGVGACPSGMVAISAYCYKPSSVPKDFDIVAPVNDSCPPGSTAGPAFCIDVFEADIVVMDPSGTETPWPPYYEPPDGEIYRAVSLRGAIPQSDISGCNAKRACEASGKRLCLSQEWERACRGPDNLTYPYGNTRMDGVCNDESLHPAYSPAECFQSSAAWIYSHLDYPGINQQDNTLSRTANHAGCVTAEGVYDMVGNVHEWIWDPLNLTSPSQGVDFRGGYYNDTKINYDGCLYRTTAHDLNQVDYSVGFRCCADAP